MAQTITPSQVEPNPLQRRLAALRRRLRLVVGFRGLSWLLAAVLLSAAAVGALDWYIHLPSLVRAVCLVATLSAAGVLAYRHLFLPLAAPTGDLALALRVEDRYGTLNDSLASTVEFLQQPADSEAHGSPRLRREAVRRALKRIDGCDFNQVIDRRGLRLAGLLMLAAVSLTAALFVYYPAQAKTGLERLANPFGGAEWPRQTLLEIDPPRERVGKNEAFEVRGRVWGVVPEEAVVTYQLDGAQVIEHRCRVVLDEQTGVGSFGTVLKPDQVQRKFRFQVRANDAVSPWYEVAVLPPPVFAPLEGRASPQVRVQPPAYTDLPAFDLPDGIGDVEAVAGTRVTLRAAADRPLARAWVEFEPEPWFSEDIVPAQLDADRQAFRVTFVPRVTGRYVLHIEDDIGLRNSRLFDLHVHDDPAPLVTLERPSDKRDLLSVLPTAELPLVARIEDPQYAVRSVWLEYRVRKAGEAAARAAAPHRLTLYDHEVAGRAAVGALAAVANPLRLREKRIDLDRRLPLAALPGVRLHEGDVLTLQVCADDFDDITLHKQPGRSHEVEVRIINRDALDIILNQEQQKVQQELLRLREKEREAIKKVADAQARLKQLGKLDGEDLNQLQQAEQAQEQVRERVGDNRREALRGEVARILEAVRNNQLPSSAAQDRMRQVGDQLERLAREELLQAEARLNSARRQSEGPEEKQRERQRQAQLLEQLAEAREKEAKAAERLAAQRPENDPTRAALQKGAQLLRQQAEELRQTAQSLQQGREEAGPERERRARLLEELAREAEKEAAGAEQRADKLPESDPNRAAQENESRQLRQLAQDLRQTAQEQSQGRSADKAKEQLAEARRHQEEVEKTLNDLLNRVLDPSASTMEVRSEARAMLQEQRRLLQTTEELKAPGAPEKPSGPQKAQLEQAQDDQRRLAERMAQLLDRMAQVQKDRAAKGDQATAQEMQAALEAATKGDLRGQMAAARNQLRDNQLNRAADSQRESVRQLQELVKQLEDRREAELDRLAKRMRELEQEMDKLLEEQEQLRKKIKDAAAIADPRKREEELKRLTRRQEELQQRAQQMAGNLQRMRMGRAGQEMERAAQRMEDALRRLERGEDPEEQQDEALDRLDEARRELEQARREVEEELAREQLAKIADQIKGLRERQEGLTAEGERLQRELLNREGVLWRTLFISLSRLSENQKKLGEETARVAEDKLTGAPVFARVLEQAAQAMERASDHLQKHAKHAFQEEKPETPDGAEAARLQKEALRRLDQLLEALKEASAQPMRGGGGGGGGGEGNGGGGGGGGGGEGNGGGGGGAPGDGIPPLAQLKLLRQLQAEVNQRTEAFHKQHPDLTKLAPERQAELQAIEREQREVANLLEELLRPANPEGGRP